MNREEIINLAREADLVTWGFQSLEWEPVKNMEAIERFAALVTAKERERWVPDVDELAQHIRFLNGNKMGAGALAEKLVDWLRSRV